MNNEEQKVDTTYQTGNSTKPFVMRRYPLGGLNEAEWSEIVGLDYVLTWHYTDDYNKDLSRYKMLSAKRWAGMDDNGV